MSEIARELSRQSLLCIDRGKFYPVNGCSTFQVNGNGNETKQNSVHKPSANGITNISVVVANSKTKLAIGIKLI